MKIFLQNYKKYLTEKMCGMFSLSLSLSLSIVDASQIKPLSFLLLYILFIIYIKPRYHAHPLLSIIPKMCFRVSKY